MESKLTKIINERVFDLYLNSKPLNITAKRIKTFKQYYNSLILFSGINEDKAFFIYKEYNFASFGISEKLDLVFVDWDNKIIHIEENFEKNKISKKIDNVKFIYIFPKNTIQLKKIILNDILIHQYNRKRLKKK